MLGTFVGDALGMPFEGAVPADVPGTPEMLEARLGRGTYTDDTQMMIALAESLLACGGVNPDHLGRAFVAAFDPRRGYGSGTTEVLQLIRSGAAPHTAARALFGGQGSQGNGAAMRIAPVAVRYAAYTGELVNAARAAAHVTHAHAVAVDAAVAQAVAIAAAANDEDPLTYLDTRGGVGQASVTSSRSASSSCRSSRSRGLSATRFIAIRSS